jgi:hypothetical protein
MATKEAASSGIGFGGALFLVFLVLKLLDKITWSWMWVTAPLWGPLALVAAIFLGIGVVVGVAAIWDAVCSRRR